MLHERGAVSNTGWCTAQLDWVHLCHYVEASSQLLPAAPVLYHFKARAGPAASCLVAAFLYSPNTMFAAVLHCAAGLPVTAVVTATALSSTLASLACGLGANLPVGLSPGMGLNAYLVFSQVCGGLGVGGPTQWGSERGGGARELKFASA